MGVDEQGWPLVPCWHTHVQILVLCRCCRGEDRHERGQGSMCMCMHLCLCIHVGVTSEEHEAELYRSDWAGVMLTPKRLRQAASFHPSLGYTARP